MKLVYELPVRPGVRIALPPQGAPAHLTIGAFKAEVGWRVEEERLNVVTLALLQQALDPAEPIAPPPGTEEAAFRLAMYVANIIFKQTGLDAVDANDVLRKSPDLQAETDEEVTLLATKKKARFLRIAVNAIATSKLDTSKLDSNLRHALALAFYADALRATDPFVRFELFYRVMEYFFPRPQNNAPPHLRNHPDFQGRAPNEIRDQVRLWDQFRHGSVHPNQNARRRDDLGAQREARVQECAMQRVACWLLDNPPPSKRR